MEKKHIKCGVLDLVEAKITFPYGDSVDTFQKLYQNYKHKMLLESKDISPVYGRMSLVGVDPVLELRGKDNRFEITVLHDRGLLYLDSIQEKDLELADDVERSKTSISGIVENDIEPQEESQRARKKNIAQIIRLFLEKYKVNDSEDILLGLYGPFAYDFVRLFEDIGNTLPETGINDFRLFLYDTFIRIDHIKEGAAIICYRTDERQSIQAAEEIQNKLHQSSNPSIDTAEVSEAKLLFSKEEYESLVRKSKEYIIQGEIFEIVYANTLQAKFQGDPFELYLRYREKNPSPYMFYFDYDGLRIIGSSPEVLVKAEDGIAVTRPLAGTIKRGKTIDEDKQLAARLLSDPKERAEHIMLVDLARNDLGRICKYGTIKIPEKLEIDRFSHVMHIVSHVLGEIKDEADQIEI